MDKTLRITIAVAVAILYYTGIISGTLAIVLGIVAITFALTSLIGFCPLYSVFGINTCSVPAGKSQDGSGEANAFTTAGTLLDVRTPAEFADGHIEGSINIPLQSLNGRIAQVKKLPQPLYVCCRSGNRSGQAVALFGQHGIESKNVGGWRNALKAIG